MGLLRPPGITEIKSWFLRAFNSRLRKGDPPSKASSATQSTRLFSTSHPTSRSTRKSIFVSQPFRINSVQSRGLHQYASAPRFGRAAPRFPRVNVKFQLTTYFLRPQVGAFPRNAGGPSLGGTASFHTSPASNAAVLSARSVSLAIQSGQHPSPNDKVSITDQITAQVAARAACQATDGPAGYIRFTLSPPAWTPTDTDLSDPDLLHAIDTHIKELTRIKTALLKLKKYGDFPVRAVLPSNPEATIDVLFRGATAEDVARWNQNEFKLNSGKVGEDQQFCAGKFEDFVRWSEILSAERKAEQELAKRGADAGLLQFWEELNMLEGRIH